MCRTATPSGWRRALAGDSHCAVSYAGRCEELGVAMVIGHGKGEKKFRI